MAKAVISNRIYLDNPGVEHTKHIIKSLTYKIHKDTGSKKFASVETIKNYKSLIKGILSIPQGRMDLVPNDYEIIDKRVLVPVPFPVPKFELYEDQQKIYDEVSDTCFINALPGWGKTFTALHLARKFGQKTLVITHTAALRDQWVEEIETLFGCECGLIGGGDLDYEDHFITVANIQTLVKHTTTILFKDYFGTVVLKPPVSNTIPPTIHMVKSGITLKPNATWVDKITDLTQDDKYRQFIADIAKMHVAEGHSVLVIADRVEFLEKVKEYVGETCLLVTGNTSFEDRQRAKEQILAKEKMCIAGSRQIFSEGISINILSCVILAVPMSNDSLLEQIAGRIMRMHEGKLDPIIVDIQFAGYADKKQNTDRLGLYLRKGWQVLA